MLVTLICSPKMHLIVCGQIKKLITYTAAVLVSFNWVVKLKMRGLSIIPLEVLHATQTYNGIVNYKLLCWWKTSRFHMARKQCDQLHKNINTIVWCCVCPSHKWPQITSDLWSMGSYKWNIYIHILFIYPVAIIKAARFALITSFCILRTCTIDLDVWPIHSLPVHWFIGHLR